MLRPFILVALLYATLAYSAATPHKGPRIAGPNAEQQCIALAQTFKSKSYELNATQTGAQYYPEGSNPSLELLYETYPAGVLPKSPTQKALLVGVGADFDLSVDGYGKNVGPASQNGPLGGLPAFCRFFTAVKTSNLTQVFTEVWMPLASNSSIPLAPINATDYPTAETPIELDENGGYVKGPPYLLSSSSAAPAPAATSSSAPADPAAAALSSSSSAPAVDDAAASPAPAAPAAPAARSASKDSSPSYLTGNQVLGTGDGYNGRLLFLGNGGLRGATPLADMKANMARYRFAVAGSNLGHWGTTGGATWINGTQMNETLEDWGKRSTHVATQLAAEVVNAYYGAKPSRSYYSGCSDGGKAGLSSAMYHPQDFDGILAGSPGINFNRMNVGQIHTQARHRVASVHEGWFSDALLAGPIHETILSQCDHLDGVLDRVISLPSKCKPDFRSALLCGRPGAKYGSDNSTCLTEPQIVNLEELFSPTIINGTQIYPRYAYGSESQAVSLTGTAKKAGDFIELAVRQQPNLEAKDGFSYWDNITYDLVKEGDRLGKDTWVTYKTDITSALQHAKIMIYHGLADLTISPYSTEDYVKAVHKSVGNSKLVDDSLRFYPITGMQHCRDGPGAWHFGGPTQNDAGNRPLKFRTDYDMLLSLVAWVEKKHVQEFQIGAAYNNRSKVIPDPPSAAAMRRRSEEEEWHLDERDDTTAPLVSLPLAPLEAPVNSTAPAPAPAPAPASASAPAPDASAPAPAAAPAPAPAAPAAQPEEPDLPTVYSSYNYGVRFTRKLCPYPKQAHYIGKKGKEGAMGVDAYKSFVCK